MSNSSTFDGTGDDMNDDFASSASSEVTDENTSPEASSVEEMLEVASDASNSSSCREKKLDFAKAQQFLEMQRGENDVLENEVLDAVKNGEEYSDSFEEEDHDEDNHGHVSSNGEASLQSPADQRWEKLLSLFHTAQWSCREKNGGCEQRGFWPKLQLLFSVLRYMLFNFASVVRKHMLF